MAVSKKNRMARFTITCLAFLTVTVSIFIISCEKPERVAKISTIDYKVSDISYTSALLKGQITDLGSLPVEDYGVVISQNASYLNPTILPGSAKPSKDTFRIEVSGLIKNTVYYYKAYLTSNSVTIYGEPKQFRTKDTGKPELTTTTASDMTLTTAKSGGSITSDGGETLIKKGLCWSKSAATDLSNAIDTTVSLASGTNFTSMITGLDQGTTYYVRSYAINVKGTGYGNELSFTTLVPTSATTLAATGMTINSATLNGTVNANNSSATVTFEYGLTTAYGQTIAASPGTVTGNTLTNVSAAITGLTQGTTYHFRVKSVSQAGTVLGGDLTFVTLILPSATTTAATQLTSTLAQLNGSVNANGSSTTVTFEYGLTTSYGSTVTASQSPVTGSTSTSVSAQLTGLTQGTTYHYRVKAVSTAGTTTGTDQTLITLVPPSATTTDATGMGATNATLNGTVNPNNTSTVVTFEYGLTTSYGSTATASQSPVTGNSPTNVSTTISGLAASTTYHFRVKAVSPGGTVYGDDFSFITTAAPVTVTDYDGNVYNVVAIGTQYWLQSNLKTTHYNNGDPITQVANGSEWVGLTSGGLSWFNDNAASYKDIYGGLYNYRAVSDVRNLCPTSWHTASDEEWTTLIDYLGGASVAGGAMKATGTTYWSSPNTGATNSSGFSILPAGYRDLSYNSLGLVATFCASGWTSGGDNYSRDFYYNDIIVGRYGSWIVGRSVRCIKGELALPGTDSASAVASTSALLRGKVNPNGASTTVTFEYGPTNSYGSEVSASQSPVSGSVPVSISSSLGSLTPGATYHYRVKAVNSGGTSYGSDMTFTCPQTVSDYEGNVYNTVIIGSQIWTQQNLKSKKYSDGSAISGYIAYGNDPGNVLVYGYLYNWFSVMNGASASELNPSGVQGVCPVGWHVPSLNEWVELDTYLVTNNGGKLKEAGLEHWADPNTGATNESGFTGLPGGADMENPYLGFMSIGVWGGWWSSSNAAPGAFAVALYHNLDGRGGGYMGEQNGYSVRCVKN